jgi:2-pyrone-4,6-dicarboxylate lactonase
MSTLFADEPARFRAPAGACDAHFHVFGPAERYPYGDDLRYAPPLAPLPDYLAHAQANGFERFVFVQPSAYGRDNTCMLDAMAQMTLPCRGIVDVDEDVSDKELDRLHALGVRGVRINVRPIKPFEAGFTATLLPRVETLDAKLAGRGWQLDFLVPGWCTRELLPTFRRLRSQFTVAHMGLFLAKDGPTQPGFLEFLDFLRNGPGRCWVKLTGVYRMSVTPGFTDADAIAQALVATAPDRLIWGSDYPHLSFADKVGSNQLFNLLLRWAPDESARRKILVDNPQALFGF